MNKNQQFINFVQKLAAETKSEPALVEAIISGFNTITEGFEPFQKEEVVVPEIVEETPEGSVEDEANETPEHEAGETEEEELSEELEAAIKDLVKIILKNK